MSNVAKNQTNPVVIDATGYTPYAIKRAENALKNSDAKARRIAAAVQDYWVKEHFIEDIENYLYHHEKDLFRSQWECSADKKGLYSRVRWEMAKINNQRQVHLEQRRIRLKEMLEEEQERYFSEEKSNEISPETKKANMFNRYKNILTQKEMERQQIAKLKKELQFRRNSDEVRTMVSNKICQLNATDGKWLAEQKNKLMKEKEEEDKMFSQAWLQDMAAKIKNQEEDERRRKKRDIEYEQYVKEQIRGTNIPKYDTPSKEDERQLMDEQNRLIELEKQWEREQKKIKQERMKKELDKCVKSKLKRKAKEVQEDLMLDLYFLDQITRADVEKQKVEEKKKALRKEQEDYIAYLSDQIKKEVEYEKALEKLYQEESDKMWERREKQWEADRRMREALNRKAIKECHEQIRNKLEKCRQVEKMKIQYDEEILKQAELDHKESVEKEQMIREKNCRNQKELLDQIEERKLQKKKIKEQEKKEQEKMKAAEVEYERKISEVIADLKIDNLHPLRMKTQGYGSSRPF